MTYNIYIDESGSLNSHGRGIFSVSMIILEDETDKRSRKFYRKQFLKLKKTNNIELTTELKGHFLRKNGYSDFTNLIFSQVREKNTVVCGYVDNRERRDLQSDKTNDEKFYEIIRLMIERAIDRKYISHSDTIRIFCDNRANISSSIDQLKQRTKHEFGINISEFKFIDSQTDVMIQVADIVSGELFGICFSSIKNNTKILSMKNVSNRKIFF